jgi:hypothetical protein
MTRLAILLALLVACTATAAPMERQMIGGELDHSLAADGDCAHFYQSTFTSFPAEVHDQEQREITLDGVEQIRVTSAPEGGLSIRGWNKPHARLIICRYAVAQTKAHANRVLGSISVSHVNGDIAARGPQIDATQAWWVNMILYVPRRANLDVKAANGGVAIRNMTGRVTAHATTGGISVAHSSGRYKITTDSGGITLDRITGLVDATSRDGSIALKIAGSDVPAIEAKTDDAGRILCTLKGCESELGSWTANRTLLKIGEGVPAIRLVTTGASIFIGPVTY